MHPAVLLMHPAFLINTQNVFGLLLLFKLLFLAEWWSVSRYFTYRSTWPIWIIRMKLIHKYMKFICIKHTNEVDLYALYGWTSSVLVFCFCLNSLKFYFFSIINMLNYSFVHFLLQNLIYIKFCNSKYFLFIRKYTD